MEKDLNYICETMGNLSGIPVRLYEGTEEVFFYSMVKLPKDPMLIHNNEILAIEEPISYFATENLNYYGIFNIEDKKIIIARHIGGDPDALGSTLGLRRRLKYKPSPDDESKLLPSRPFPAV